MHRRGAIQIPSELQEVIIIMFEKVVAELPHGFRQIRGTQQSECLLRTIQVLLLYQLSDTAVPAK